MDHSHILLNHLTRLNSFGKLCCCLLFSGIHHNTAYVFVKAVYRENIAAKLCGKERGHLLF